ncbi:hypothetical protein MG293_002052 [Ovis ammon polii]|uniref:Uncharacterized protein n=1 Tax=Ovis ammon polii TaxID=230172 RepID=A0AAD4UNE6_OVIAM|nr:hypothetical protein MG293_002052 [Ovis ammon polii]
MPEDWMEASDKFPLELEIDLSAENPNGRGPSGLPGLPVTATLPQGVFRGSQESERSKLQCLMQSNEAWEESPRP